MANKNQRDVLALVRLYDNYEGEDQKIDEDSLNEDFGLHMQRFERLALHGWIDVDRESENLDFSFTYSGWAIAKYVSQDKTRAEMSISAILKAAEQMQVA